MTILPLMLAVALSAGNAEFEKTAANGAAEIAVGRIAAELSSKGPAAGGLRKAMLDDHPWSLAECATRYGISRERVRQLEQEAITKLIAWKQADDERRAAERRKIRMSPRGLVCCFTATGLSERFAAPANAAVPPESVSSDGKFMLAKTNAAKPALGRRSGP